MKMMTNNELIHFGVLGMKWGVRRSSGSNVTKGERLRTTASEDYKKSRELRKKKLSSLSNSELKSLNERLQLEQNYKNLNPKHLNKGLQIAKKVTAAGTTVASLYALTKTPLGQDVIRAVKARTGGA